MGRSDGVAFVTYTSLDDANEAIRKYDGANAAGQPITVTLDTETPRRPIGSGNRSRGRGFTRGPSRMGPRMGSGRGERGERRPQRTQEDLDKELDDFMSAPPPTGNGNGEEMAID
jgi:THO complex subunit 4